MIHWISVVYFYVWTIGFVEVSNSIEIYANQPKIITQDGHMIFMTADNHNITFRSQGAGSIRVNEEDLIAVVKSAKESVAELQRIKNDEIISLRQSVSQIQNELSRFNQLNDRVSAIDATLNRINNLISRSGINGTNQNVFTNQRRLTQRVNRFKTRLDTLEQNLERNECNSNPCRNGGTCLDGYKRFSCRCPTNWEGPTCDENVNECAVYAGTGLGCQNGATCIDNLGSYSCICPAEWYGIHCTQRHDDCSSASHEALCGHGTCIKQTRTQIGQPQFTCICDEGWKTDGRNPACNIDVNECLEGRSPCSKNPLVPCINIEGSVRCGTCPAGYTGDGYTCSDINECFINNGGCSPFVQCENTVGSRRCGSCPAGYQGNGEMCSYVGVCNIINGGCHPLATCTAYPTISSTYRECRCPPGYGGDGNGPNGCIYQSSVSNVSVSSCDPNPCVRGTCVALGFNSFRCNCPLGYTGVRCEIAANECLSQPCQNGGTCTDQINGYSCICTEHYTGTNCEQPQDICGARLNQPNGTLRYPSNPSVQYQHDQSCAWVITTTSGKVLNITFLNFHLEMSSDHCVYDFLQFNDGNSAASHAIGRYCGEQLPKNIITTHNSVYIWFHSDSSNSGYGFQIKWETIDPICGGDVSVQDYGSINSPGYPGMYPTDRDCVWTVNVPPGKRIKFLFPVFQLEHHDNCNYDFLKIYDGTSESDHILATFCSTPTTNIPPLITSGSYARLYFHSDESLNANGFHITFNSEPGTPGCGGLLTDQRGSFSSPNFPNRYENGLECDWVIRSRPNEKIRLIFSSIDIEASYAQNCYYDYVAIYDGQNDEASLVGRYCGRNTPPTVVSSGNFLLVKFRTDTSVVRGGFQATYETVCGGVYDSPQGIFHSPNYPDPYAHSRECIYIIQLPPGKVVKLWFEAFDIEGWTTCDYDYLEIRDGISSSAPLLGIFCGVQIPDPIISTYNFLWLRFATDETVRNRGFLANYTSIDVACGGIFHNETTGIIESPSHPEQYILNTTCRWIIQPMSGFVIRLTFTAFAVEDHWNCMYDYVEIYDNTTVEDEHRRMGRFCGHRLPPLLTSSDNLMYIIFHSDTSIARDGFSAQFTSFNSVHSCGGNFYTNMGAIQSPNYPSGYPHSRDCTWTIQVPTGKQILLNITDFRLSDSSQCVADYLEIRNGGHVTSPLIGKFCGTTIPRLIPSHSHQLWLRFVSNPYGSSPGFRLTWDGTTTGCGGELISTEGVIASPGYPMPCTGRSAICRWRITVNRGNRIRLVFTDLDTSNFRPGCSLGVHIFDGSSTKAPLLGRFCGNRIPDPILSTSNEIFVMYFCTFLSDSRRGFRLAYSTECNAQLSGRRGLIESPNFPNPYPNFVNCSWNINTKMGNKINMSFSILNLEHHRSCQYDFVEIRENAAGNTTSIGKYCGIHDVPPLLSSQTNGVKVNFKTDFTLAHEGFSLEWVASGCGNEFTKSSGTFSTPYYPAPYPVNTFCEWEIRVDLGQRIELTVQEYDMESSSNCNFDSVKVYGGRDETAPLLTSLCHQQSFPSVITSSGNLMYLIFKSDYSIHGRGFLASYVALPGGCGGRFTVPEGVIHSRNFPGSYFAQDDCTWLITVSEGHTVNLQFTNFDVRPRSNCSAVYVAIYDGPYENDTLLLKHCGSSLPSPANFSSTSNQVLIRMKAHDSITANGFQLKYFRDCGAMLYADEPGEISLGVEGGARSARASHNCTWIIRAKNLADRVSLTITYLDKMTFSNRTSCNNDYVEVYDGEANDSQILQHICLNMLPPTITSRGSSLRVVAVSRFNRLHFRAVYHETSIACGGDLQALQGSFTSPEYPNSYPNDIECVWTIKSSPGSKVMVTFSFFNIQQSDHCNRDYVEIRETNLAGRLLGRYCGNEIPAFNFTVAEQLVVKFRSDSEDVAQGFMASYSLVRHSELSGTAGQIASPLYPQRFRNIGEFSWTVTVPTNMYVKITFIEMLLSWRRRQRCNVGLKIYDGPDKTATLLGDYCSSEIPNPVVSRSNQLHIYFSTWRSSAGALFMLNWTATMFRPWPQFPPRQRPTLSITNITGCQGYIYLNYSNMYLPENHYILRSPGYPTGYSPSLLCEWIFSSPVSTSVAIQLNLLDLQLHNYGCWADYLEIWGASDVPGAWKNLGKYCQRNQQSKVIKSSGNTMKVQFRTSPYLNRTGFSASVYPVCGANLTGPSGVIESPFYPQNYPSSQNCQWSVSVRPGRTIEVEFTDLQLEGDAPTCQNDYVLLRNGLSNESPVLGIGKYCGSSMPQTPKITTTGNHFYAQFVTNAAISRKGFRLLFSEVSVECGRVIILNDDNPSTIIQTPNFPSAYPYQTECRWRIVAPTRKRIQMHFEEHFDIPSSDGCLNNYLTVHDGGTVHSPVLQTLCGQNMPGTIQSSSNTLFVKFSGNDRAPSIGFKATIKIGDCGGTVIADYGSITSPNYPNGYTANLDCEWIVRVHPGHFIQFNVANLRTIKRNNNCSVSDSLVIRDFNSTGEILGEFCGLQTNLPVQTSDNVAYVRFKSQSSSTYPGFLLNFNTSIEECGGELTTPNGIITSPNFPRPYPRSRTCHWTIQAMRGRKIRLSFTHFDMDYSHLRWCPSFVVVFNDLQERYVLAPYYMCGTTTPSSIVSTSNMMSIKFHSGDTVSGTGFRAVYDTDLEWDCGGDLPLPSGNLTSPGFGNGNYSHHMNCFWNLNSPHTNASFVFRFHFFTLENPSSVGRCVFDLFQIIGGLDEDGVLFASLCGNISTPYVIAVPFSQIYLKFRTDESIAHAGLFITYTTTVSCGNQVPEVGGILSSPSYPSNYFDDTHCAWLINLQEGQQAQITFEDIQLQSTDNCSSDYILIRNGPSLSSPVIGKYCGGSVPTEIRTQRHEALIEFHTNTDGNVGRGFRLSVTPVTSGCGGVLHGENGQLSSVGYPNNYPGNTECEWILEGEDGYFFNITFIERFDLELYSKCENDFIEGFNFINGEWVSSGRICGHEIPPPIISKTNRFRLIFRSNEAIDGDGFKANWTKNCGGIYSDKEGAFQSPNYPGNYVNNMNCIYLIKLEDGVDHYTVLTFDDYFSIEDSENCIYDYVEVFGFVNGRNQTLRKTCGTTSPGTFSSRGAMTVRFKTDISVVQGGFRVNYRLSECGGILRGPNGIIASPTHPDRYLPNTRCTWNVIGDPDRVIAFQFSLLALENHCNFDYVAVYDGSNTTDNEIGMFCGPPVPPVFKSTSSNATIKFVTDSSVENTGFKLLYRSTFGENHGCGGYLNTSSGTIQSLDHDRDGKYEFDLDCIWTIIGEEFKVITLTFQNFNVEETYNRTSCSWDYLEIRDGMSQSSPLIARLCGTSIPPPITTSSNKLWLYFVTDDTNNRPGFTATYQVVNPICGGVFNASTDDWTIQSPNYPGNYPINIRCQWVIMNPRRLFIRMHFDEFKMENSSLCYRDYLHIEHVISPSYTQDFKYCGTLMPSDHYIGQPMTQIHFSSDSSTTNKGFKLTFSTRFCNRTASDPYGLISSKIMASEGAQDCISIISVPAGRTIVLIFTIVVLRPSCDDSYVEIRDGSTETASLLGKLCGTGARTTFFSTQNNMYLKLRYVRGQYEITYKASYYSTDKGPGCGGEIFANDGYIVSPNYPGNYSQDSICQWTITVPHNRYILGYFPALDIQPVGNCTSNYLEMYDSNVPVDSHKLQTICAGDRYYGTVSTKTNTLFIRYITDTSNTGNGFQMRFESRQVEGLAGMEPLIEVVQRPSNSPG